MCKSRYKVLFKSKEIELLEYNLHQTSCLDILKFVEDHHGKIIATKFFPAGVDISGYNVYTCQFVNGVFDFTPKHTMFATQSGVIMLDMDQADAILDHFLN